MRDIEEIRLKKLPAGIYELEWMEIGNPRKCSQFYTKSQLVRLANSAAHTSRYGIISALPFEVER